MKKRLLGILVLAAVSLQMFAATEIFSSDSTYYLYNVGAESFLNQGEAWGTQAACGSSGMKVYINPTNTEGQYTINTSAGQLFRTSGDVNAGEGGVFTDGSKQGTDATLWVIQSSTTHSGCYTIQAPSSSSFYVDGQYFGLNPDKTTYTSAFYYNTDISSYVDECQWIIYTQSKVDSIEYVSTHTFTGTLSGNLNNLRSNLTLPTIYNGNSITWTSSEPAYLSATGEILQRPAAGEGKKHVVLTATIGEGLNADVRTFDVYLAEDENKDSYLFVYFPSNSDENLYYAISYDGFNYTPLNWGEKVMSSDTVAIKKGIRDPHILRGEDGNTFYMVATDMKCSEGWASNRGIVMYKSTDLVHWTHSTVHFPTRFPDMCENVTRVWAPETIWDPDYDNGNGTKGRYMVYFSLLTSDGTINYDKVYYSHANDDFTDLLEEPVYFYDRGSATIDCDIAYFENDSLFHMIYKNEGSGGICQVTAKSLLPDAGAENGSQWGEPSGTLQQTSVAVEGGGLFRIINSDEWVLMYDCYSSGYYQFCSTSDFDTFSLVAQTTTSGAFTPRHGTVISLTPEETAAVLSAFPYESTNSAFSSDSTYYLYNVGAESYLTGGEAWGAQAACGSSGLGVTIIGQQDSDVYTITTTRGQLFRQYSSVNTNLAGEGAVYVDGSGNGSDMVNWVITPSTTLEGAYTIQAPSSSSFYADGEYFGLNPDVENYTTGFYSNTNLANYTDNCQWQILTQYQIDSIANAGSIVDPDTLIEDPDTIVVEPDTNAVAIPSFDTSKVYYLYNIGASSFLNKGEAWGVQAACGNAGLPVTLGLTDEEGVYTLTTSSGQVFREYSSSGSNLAGEGAVYVDGKNKSDDQKLWTISFSTTYDGAYVIQAPDSSSLYAENEYFGYIPSRDSYETAFYHNTDIDTYSDYCQWIIYTADEYDVINTIDVPSPSTISSGSTYYMYNVGAKKYLAQGEAWGTQAACGTTGLKVTATLGSNNYYYLTTEKGQLFRTSTDANAGVGGVFTDGNRNRDNATLWNIVASSDYDGAYTVQTPSTYTDFYVDGEYFGLNPDKTSYTTGFYYNTVKDSYTDECQWIFVSEDDYLESISKITVPAKRDSIMCYAGNLNSFGEIPLPELNSYKGFWNTTDIDASSLSSASVWNEDYGTNPGFSKVYLQCISDELINGTLYQQIANLPSGYYTFSADVYAYNTSSSSMGEGLSIFANTESVSVSASDAKQTVSVTALVLDGKLNIGLQDVSSNNAIFISNPKVTYALPEYVLNTSDNGYATLILPFNAELPESEDLRAYVLTSLEGTSAVFETATSIEANRPMLIHSEGGEQTDIMAVGNLYSLYSNSLAEGLLNGTYFDDSISSGYVLDTKDGKTAFYAVSDNTPVEAFSAYMIANSEAKKYNIVLKDSVTGINEMPGMTNGSSVESVYDVNGISLKGLRKGLNIVRLSDGKVQKIYIR